MRFMASVDIFDCEEVDDQDGEVPTWTNVVVTDGTPIRWYPEYVDPRAADVAVRLVIGHGQQLTLDLTAGAVRKILAALGSASQDGAPGERP